MRSSSDGALATRAEMPLDARFLQLVGTKLRAAGGGVEVATFPNSSRDQQKQEQPTQWGYDDLANSPPIPVVTSQTAQAFSLSSALKGQSASSASIYDSSGTQDGVAPAGYSIPAVSQMFIHAVQDLHTSRTSEDDVSTPKRRSRRSAPVTKGKSRRGVASGKLSRRAPIERQPRPAAVPMQSPFMAANQCEAPETTPNKNSTLEFGKKYSELRVKVKRSFRKRGTDGRQVEERPRRIEATDSIEETLRRLQDPRPRVLANRPKPVEKKRASPPHTHPQPSPPLPQVPKVALASSTMPEIAPASAPKVVEPPSKDPKTDMPAARPRHIPEYEETCVNAFWCMWIVGFIFPVLWVGGSTGIFSSSRCGFIAGMTNVISLLVAIIVVVIFFL
ncbi:unnamed protein product [Ostreobium quekettii]|uniref:Uncharacterized protein n=1 Tax=Ostreobium quekettii TaxID=121088 RepID=A0A8S1IMY2_9CHLO|nr:unnamed protein product [Ostreobium quekettii]|eukprot:evm.model.scf_2673.2 EVM.evm.TU.scf_2673.2   scf_2673:12513-15482(-)